jgi:hypothetical protein
VTFAAASDHSRQRIKRTREKTMRSTSFITIIAILATAAALAPPAKAAPKGRAFAATVESVTKRALTVTLADEDRLTIGVSRLGRGPRGRRLLPVLQRGDRLLVLVRVGRNGLSRVRLVLLVPPLADEGPDHEPGDYVDDGYEGGGYEGGDYEPAAASSVAREGAGR